MPTFYIPVLGIHGTATGMPAGAADFSGVARRLAIGTAVFTVARCRAITAGMCAFLCFGHA